MKRSFTFMIFGLLAWNTSKAQNVAQECPEENGYYADSVQCDRYYQCQDGQIYDKLCPDGLVFDESSTNFAKCSFQFSVDCTGRPELQPAQGYNACPRLNGYFPHEDPKVCDKFYFCVDGVANPITCPASLIFDPSKGQCAYSDQIERKGCSGQEVFHFECPSEGKFEHEHPRFPDPDDCQFFYICINGVNPRRNGCTDGLVFNKKSLACERPDNVEDECKTWYNETFLEGLKQKSHQNLRPITSLKTRKRVKVIRKNPNAILSAGERPGAQPPSFQDPRVGTGGAFPISPQAEPIENRPVGSRSRVRQRRPAARPVHQQAQEFEEEVPEGPPAFALNDQDSIQQFRRNHGFNNGGGNSRLTILQTPTNPLAPVESVTPIEEEDPSPPVPSRRQRPPHRRRPISQQRTSSPASRGGEGDNGGRRQEFDSFQARF